MKNVYRVSTKQHGDMKSGVSRSKNATSLQAQCASALSCSNIRMSICPHRLRLLCTFFCHQRARFFTLGAG